MSLPRSKPYIRETPTSKALHFASEETQSRMLRADPDRLVLDYTQLMMGFLLYVPAPRDIVMIGLGGGSLVKFCHRWLPAARIDVVEINPDVVALRRDFCVPDDDARLAVHEDDGARYVRHTTAACDVLLLDAYDGAGIPAALQTRRFLDDCRRSLRPGGVFVANLNAERADAAPFVERIAERIGPVLSVDDAERSNRIVLAGAPIRDRRIGEIRRPRGLSKSAWAQLVLPFARIRMAQGAVG